MSSDTEIFDPDASEAGAAALAAFEAARRAGRPSVQCYRAAVAAWRALHPDQTPEYTAKRAVSVVLAAHVKFRIDE
jgi:hypothetical protein